MKRRPSHRQKRITRKRCDLNERTADWLRRIIAKGDDVTIGCHTMSYHHVIYGKNIPGVPK